MAQFRPRDAESRCASRPVTLSRMGYERYDEAGSPRWRERLGQYWKLVRGDRPIGVMLLLWWRNLPRCWAGFWAGLRGLLWALWVR